MGYRLGHYYRNSTGSCVSIVMYFPDSNSVRSGISNAYKTLFGRYAEPGGISFHEILWATGNYSSYSSMVAGTSMAEAGAYNGLSAGGCPPPIVLGCTDSRATNYVSNATAGNYLSNACTYAKPTISISTNKTSIVRPDTTSFNLTYSISSTIPVYGRIVTQNNVTIKNLYANSGTVVISPASNITGSTSYTVKATNVGGQAISNVVKVTVYDKPEITLKLSENPINEGQSSELSWTITGDATTLNIQPGIGNTNITSFETVSPTVTTTYTAKASHSIAGEDTDEIELIVYPSPSIELIGPERVNYGEDVTIQYKGKNIPTEFIVTPYYYSLDGIETIGQEIELDTGDDLDDEFTDTPPWDDRGPSQIAYIANVEGYGEQKDSDNIIVNVDIDQEPDQIAIPESEGKIKNEQPVYTPGDQLNTNGLLINDIDIPVEIKADSPIKVEIDDSGNYQDVRPI